MEIRIIFHSLGEVRNSGSMHHASNVPNALHLVVLRMAVSLPFPHLQTHLRARIQSLALPEDR